MTPSKAMHFRLRPSSETNGETMSRLGIEAVEVFILENWVADILGNDEAVSERVNALVAEHGNSLKAINAACRTGK